MKLIAVLMAILIILELVGVPRENAGRTASHHRLITEAASAGKIQRRDAAGLEKEPEVMMTQAENPKLETVPPIYIAPEPEHEQSAEQPVITPVHEHTWIPVTETVHHEPVYRTIHHEAQTERVWVEDKPAWDETYENTTIVAIHAVCKGCGIDLNEAGMTDEEHDEHDLQHILNGEDSSYYEVPIFQTVTEAVHHEAEGRYEDVVVQAAYDETVLVSEAWEEEMVTGYVCEECGEVR